MAESMWLRKAHFGRDRRGAGRVPCAETTIIDVLSPNPRSAQQARIVNVGPTSLKLGLPFFVSPGSLIRIHMTDCVAKAEVRYCVCEGAEYFLGVKVDEIVPKKAEVEAPADKEPLEVDR